MPKHFLFLMFFAVLLVPAQTPVQTPSPCIQQACFFAVSTATVAASGSTTITIQQPTSGSKFVSLNAAVLQCAGQTFTITQSQNGTAATATTVSSVALLPIQFTGSGNPISATAIVYGASNVGAGSATSLALPTTNFQVIDLSQRAMSGNGGTAGPNYSLTLTNTGSSSCSASIAIYWSEKI